MRSKQIYTIMYNTTVYAWIHYSKSNHLIIKHSPPVGLKGRYKRDCPLQSIGDKATFQVYKGRAFDIQKMDLDGHKVVTIHLKSREV